MTGRDLEQPCHAAIRFLMDGQNNGMWHDFDLPVGVSSEWTTGYVGWSLAESAKHWQRNDALQAASRAAEKLATERAYSVGWGYNHTTGADTDSTACVIALMDETNHPVNPVDRKSLAIAWRRGKGFATYPEGPGHWASGHLDVTWPALKGAGMDDLPQQWSTLKDVIVREYAGQPVPAYWWSDPWYCHYHLMKASLWADGFIDERLLLTPKPDGVQVHDWASLAFLTGVMACSGQTDVVDRLLAKLVEGQNDDGSWPSAPSLRVTDHHVSTPHRHAAAGVLYADQHRLFTTASILRVISALGSSA